MRHAFRLSPAITPVDIVQAGNQVFDPRPLRALLVLADGTLEFVDVAGVTHTVVFPVVADGGSYPFLFECPIRQINDGGTTLTDAEMLGFRE